MAERGPASEATPASAARLELAQRLAASCPPELAGEVAVSGSVAAGWADADSDVELNLFVDALPAPDARLAWLARLGAVEVELDLETSADGTSWSSFRVDGVAIEAGWQETGSLEQWLRGLLAAETVDHGALVAADALVHALPLRTHGALGRWRRQLSEYPEPLRDRLVADAVADWRASWSRLPLARRGDRLRLTKVLVDDCQRVLRILFALNGLWEPDWKWIDYRIRALTTKPPRLGERLDAVLLDHDATEAVYACYSLIRDALALAPDRPEVGRAREWVSGQLAARE